MRPFVRETGICAVLPQPNIDTDVIMPKRFLKTIDRAGLGEGALHDLRFEGTGAPRLDFILNRTPWAATTFLVVGPNFGCGSSREHAVWGLMQLGIRAIIGTSYGGIFFDNAARNGLLLIELQGETVAGIQRIVADPARCRLTIDLEARRIDDGGDLDIGFAIDPLLRENLLSGRDHIGATLDDADAIGAFETLSAASSPWLSGRRLS